MDILNYNILQVFEQAKKLLPPDEKDFTDYTNFLFQTNQYDAAIELTEQIIGQYLAQAPSEWCQAMSLYDMADIKTVDANLQREIEYAKEIEVAPLIYAFYLLVS